MAWTVGDVMTREVVTVGPETDFKTCVDLLRINGVSALPVVEGGYVLGMVSEHDLLLKEEGRGSRVHLRRRELNQARGRTAGDVMHSPALCVGLGASLTEAARLMHRRAVKRLPVLDARGKLVGIVSRHDLLKTYLRSDESIRREIRVEVLQKEMWIDDLAMDVDVKDGVVALVGEVETKSLADLVTRMVGSVEGVVGVDSRLAFRLDDTHVKPELPPNALQLSASERQA
ncbi:MAG TPA: CBS domain-containing protein [Candidatus Dormibacteraeota bacterium]